MPRLRVFAGPNGSGKSTIIKTVQQYKHNGKLLNIGCYINADDIAKDLTYKKFSFLSYNTVCTRKQLLDFAKASGLINASFSIEAFSKSFIFSKGELSLKSSETVEYLAQILARFLREQMLLKKETFCFETVFSHPSNVDIMRQAVAAGFKVYLYFVSTESPEINKYRVQVRVKQGGHNVPADKIEQRYYKSLELMYDAADICYQSYFFDNSADTYRLIAHYKDKEEKLKLDKAHIPRWFKKYFIDKQANKI
jgi:predicted ABC-type ATPase